MGKAQAERFVRIITEDTIREISHIEKGKRTPEKTAERIAKRICGMLVASKVDHLGDFFLLSDLDKAGLCDYSMAGRIKRVYPTKKLILERFNEQVKEAKKKLRDELSFEEKEILGID